MSHPIAKHTKPTGRSGDAARSPEPDGTTTRPAYDSYSTEWLNSLPLTAADLRGRVVLVDFWTYTCINWLRTLPYVRAWAHKYQDHGLVLLGVHTPEFDFEHDLDNVRRAVKDLRVDFPVAVDNHYAIWSAFDNHYWPALYLIDAQAGIRHHRFGEGDNDRSERIVQRLLVDAGIGGVGQDLVAVEAGGVQAEADWDSLWSPENHLGAERTENFASANGAVLDTPHRYAAPTGLRLNQWGLSGDWTVKRQPIVLNEAGGEIVYRFHARDLHLVMAPPAPGTPVRVPGAARRTAAGRRARHRRRRPGQRHPHRSAPVPAGPPAGSGRRAHLPGRLPGSRCPGLRLHLRLDDSGDELAHQPIPEVGPCDRRPFRTAIRQWQLRQHGLAQWSRSWERPGMDMTVLARSLLDPIHAHRTAGIEVARAADGAAEVEMVVPPALTNVIGSLHSSGLVTLVDSAGLGAIIAACASEDELAGVLGASASPEFLSPARGRLVASCRLGSEAEHAVRRLQSGEHDRARISTVTEVRDAAGVVVCRGTFVWSIRRRLEHPRRVADVPSGDGGDG